MRVIWYNTWSLPVISTKQHINKSINYIIQSIKKYHPDVVILSELFDFPTRHIYKTILQKTLPNWIFSNIGTDTQWYGQQCSGIFVLYRENGFSLKQERSHILPYAARQDKLAAKALINLEFINHNNEILHICTTHLQDPDAGGFENCKQNTINQLNWTIRMADQWSNGNNCIIIGDFNIVPNETPTTLYNIASPQSLTHIPTQQVLDYALHTLNRFDIKINTLNIPNNPSDHHGILLEYIGFNKTSNVTVIEPVQSAPNRLIDNNKRLTIVLIFAFTCFIWINYTLLFLSL